MPSLLWPGFALPKPASSSRDRLLRGVLAAGLVTSILGGGPARAGQLPGVRLRSHPAAHTEVVRYSPVSQNRPSITLIKATLGKRARIVRDLTTVQPPANETQLDTVVTNALAKKPLYAVTKGSGGIIDQNPPIVEFQAPENSLALYPGALVQGASYLIDGGQLASIPLPTGPGTVTVTGLAYQEQPNGSPYSASRHVTSATQQSITDAIASIATQPKMADQMGISIYCQDERIYSLDDLMWSVNASFGYLGMASVKASMSEADDKTTNHALVFCTQEYYTATFTPDLNTTDGPSRYFATSVTPNQVNRYISVDPNTAAQPLALGAVTYGAEVMLLVNSTHSADDIKAALNGSFNDVEYSGSVDASAESKQVLDTSTINCYAIGGHASGARGACGVLKGGDTASAIQSYLDANLDVVGTSPNDLEQPEPLFYTLNFLDQTLAVGDATVKGSTTQASPVHLTSATIAFHQNGDGKDYDTTVDAYLTDQSGSNVMQFHQGNLGENSASHYADNSDVGPYSFSFINDPSKFPIEQDALMPGQFKMIIHPNGHDTWHYTATLTLHFSNGYTFRGQGSSTLDQDNTEQNVVISKFFN